MTYPNLDNEGLFEDNPYSVPENMYECPHNCRDMSTPDFLLYSIMCVSLGFCVGVIVGIIAC